MPRATILCAGVRVISCPRNRILPDRARTSPEIARSVVDFPAPLAPMRVTISPSATSRETPCRASMSP